MKKALVLLTVLCMLAGFAGCAGGSADGKAKLGVATVTNGKVESEKATMSVLIAAVLVDENGKITACDIDEGEFASKIADGKADIPTALATKGEKGEAYGMKGVSPIGKEWNEQVAAFCEYVVGKTADEVAAIALTDGKATDADLTAGCTIAVSHFVKAVADAAKNATVEGASAADKVNVAITAAASAAKDEVSPKIAVEYAAVSVAADGKVTACFIDGAETTFTVENGAFTGESGAITTKGGLKDQYGMKGVSPIGKEWYEQVDALAKYMVGKTATDIGGLKMTDGKIADLSASCTIYVGGMVQNVAKAATI
jgi:hypothetical protein